MSMVKSCMEDVSLYQYVKIALAVMVIKRKPKDLSVKSYVSELLKHLQFQDGNWNEKVFQQGKMLLERQQEWVSKILSADMDLDVEVTTSCSGSELSRSRFQTHQRYMHLLKNVTSQCNSTKNPIWSMEEESVFLWNTLLGAIEYLTTVTQNSKSTLPVPKGMYLACIKKVQEMLLVIDDYSEVKPKMEHMVDSLIKCLLQWKGTSLQSTRSDEIRDILLSLGSSPVFGDICLSRLAWHVQEFASCLKLVVKGECELCSQVMTYQNIFHVLLVLEEILKETSLKRETSSETVSAVCHQLNGSLLHISKAFPVFSHFLWRLQVLLLEHPSFLELEKQNLL